METIGPLRGAQPLVDLQKQLADVFDNVLADFVQVSQADAAGQLDRQSAELRKHRLLQHLHSTRQQLLRAVALINWKPWKVLTELVDHERVLDIAASHVRTMHEVVGQMRQQAAGRIMAGSYLNMYDVNTALEVLTTGTYQELPSIILHRPPLFQPPPASLARQRSRLAHVTQLIRSRLVQVPLPPGLKVVNIVNGTVVLRAEGLYEAKLTLVPSEPLPGIDPVADSAAAAGNGPGPSSRPPDGDASSGDWAATAMAAATADPAAAAAAAQRWKWRLIHFVLMIGVPFYDPRQPGQILNTCNFHMVLAADNAAYLRRKRPQTGGAAPPSAPAAAPAHSTLSESTATPAASGLPQAAAAAAGGAGASAGGSLAAAVKRSEDDEVGAPLAVMHAILTDVAGRLLVDELAAAARALAAPGSRWHGHINVKPSQILRPGVRIEYWVTAPPLLNPRALPNSGEDFRYVKPGPPYLELGMGDGGCVEVLHGPSSLHKPMAVSKLRLDTFRVNLEEVLMRAANMSSMFQLLLIRSELKANLVEAMGKRAPTTRLTTLARQLWCREGASPPPGHPSQQDAAQQQQQQSLLGGTVCLAEDDDLAGEPLAGQQRDAAAARAAATAVALSPDAAGTTAASATPMEVDGGPGGMGTGAGAGPSQPQAAQAQPVVPIPAPTAPPPEISGLLAHAAPPEEAAGALVVLNAPVLEYLVSGTTELKIGKHLFSGRLTLRPGQDERDEGSLDHAATIAMNEDYVNQAALSAYNTAAASADYPAARALKEACAALSHVLQRTHTSTDATHFIQAARRAALHISRLPRGMLEAFTAASPGLAIEPRPREKAATWALQSVPFPANFPPLEPVALDTPPLRVPQCLSFFLQSRLSLTSPHVLVVCSCTKQLMPIKVLSCIPVPPSTYRLPEHVVAAYMAAASHHQGHAHGHTHQHSSGGGNHSLPHSGANSPRAVLNGHEAAGRSPETSPLRESTVGAIVAATNGAGQGRMSIGGASGATAAAAAAAIAGCAGSEPGGMPSLPSTCSPPHPPQSNSKLKASSGPASVRGLSARNGGAAAGVVGAHGSGPSGRPTGQQVAVMLAQQQLSSVVRWCRRRMVWEVLLVQLQAVGAAFEELCSRGTCQRLRVTRVAGTQLPCLLARRRGLTPARVGPTCLELELGPDALAGQVTARLYGRFLCSPACAPPHAQHDDASPQHAAGSGFMQEPFPSPLMQPPFHPAGSGPGTGGDAGLVCLRRRYCLERGESALTMVQEVCAVIRTQTFLARLEMTALPVPATTAAAAGRSRIGVGGCGVQAQRLAVLAPLPRPACGDSAGRSLGPHPLHRAQRSYPHLHSTASQQLLHAYGSLPDSKLGVPGNNGPAHGYGHPLKAAAHGSGDGGPAEGGLGSDGTAGSSYGSPHPAKRIKTEPGVRGTPGELDGQLYACANGAGAGAGMGLDGWQQHGGVDTAGSGHGHGGAAYLANGGTAGDRSRAGLNGGGSAGAGSASASAPPSSRLTWHWPLVGTLTLEEYSFNAATIRVNPCTTPGQKSPAVAPASQAPHHPPAGGDTAEQPPPPPLQLHITWAQRDVRHLHGSAAAAPPPPPPQSPPGLAPSLAAASPAATSPSGVAATPSPYTTAPTLGSSLTAQTPAFSGMLPLESVVTTTRTVVSRSGDLPFGSFFADLVLCTFSCSSGHSLPPEYLHVLEEFAEAGEEGKLLDAVAVAAWPLSGFCSALRPAVLVRYGLTPDSDVRLTLHQPPYCHRIVCRRRSAPGHLLIDLVCQAVGRSYLKLSLPSLLPGQSQPQPQQDIAPERQSTSGGPMVKTEAGAAPEGALQAVQQLARSRLGSRGVHVSVGGRAAMYTGLGPRPPAVPGPGSPLWLLVPNDCVQAAVEIALSVL